ncbi:hypothetical protein Sme01_09040 [Sphaerisporangium melleum]|nr:hypothetical protein Sme01_09040 [Sphaerisporangium melleum]
MMERIKEYLRGPKGQEHAHRVKVMARDPQNQSRLRYFMDRWRSRGTHH